MAHGSSRGMSVTAVSVLRVLAGRKRPCGSLAPRIWPVSASAPTQLEAVRSGAVGAPAPTITPPPSIAGPPTGPSGGAVGCDEGGSVTAGVGCSSAAAGQGSASGPRNGETTGAGVWDGLGDSDPGLVGVGGTVGE